MELVVCRGPGRLASATMQARSHLFLVSLGLGQTGIGMQRPQMPSDRAVVVLGASPKPVRYAYQAVKLLHDEGFRVIPVHPRAERIDQIPVVHDLGAIHEPVDTLTLYIGPERIHGQIHAILALRPGRVILNPGTESIELELALGRAGIPSERACTLVLLRTGQF